MNALNKRTVAIELAYQFRKGQFSENPDEAPGGAAREEAARRWAEMNGNDFLDDAERLLTKLRY